MPRYLIVADQTVTSPDLVARASQLARAEPDSTFSLLLPALLPSHIRGGPFDAVTRGRAEQAKRLLGAAGIEVARTAVGDAAPLLAIEDELTEHPGAYDTIILCTLPEGISRWLRMNVHGDAAERFGLPLIHVEARMATRLEFRRATLHDHERIQALWDESRLDTVDEHEWDTLITSTGAIVLVAEEEGALVGAIVGTFDGWRAYVYHVAVVPGRRRRGVAKALFEEAQAHLAREGNRIVYVMVNEENEGGMALLHSLGYRQQGDIVMVNEIGDGSDAD
ncbi:MAG: GNAT family N-acetyltransferase [Chloroflexi bacterium]|nr:GNAT family N-acetyltransferase [Chloroflexota bacterium]